MTYRVRTKAGDEFRNTEFFVFAGDRIKSIDVYFGVNYRDGALSEAERDVKSIVYGKCAASR